MPYHSTKFKTNPFVGKYFICRYCDRLTDSKGFTLHAVPDDSPGILMSNVCADCAPSDAVIHGLRPAAWIVGAAYVGLVVFHLVLLVVCNW